MTTTLLLTIGFLGRWHTCNEKCDAPESHIAYGAPRSFISALWMRLSNRPSNGSDWNRVFTCFILNHVEPTHQYPISVGAIVP
eukprot:11352257-Prorocentrum_lima.AAC.1